MIRITSPIQTKYVKFEVNETLTVVEEYKNLIECKNDRGRLILKKDGGKYVRI